MGITNYNEHLIDSLDKDTLFQNPEDSGISDEVAFANLIKVLKLESRKFCTEMRDNRNKLKQIKQRMLATTLNDKEHFTAQAKRKV